MRYHSLILLLPSLTVLAQTGTIRGTVSDSNGSPIGGVTVRIEPTSADGREVFTTSSESGLYELDNVPFGRYRVLTESGKAGQPSRRFQFYRGPSFQDTFLTISKDHPSEERTLRLPQPLKSVSLAVIDGDTGQAIPRAALTLRRQDDPTSYVMTGASEFGLLTITFPDTPVIVEVSAPGYKPSSILSRVGVETQDSQAATPSLRIALSKAN